MMGGALHALQSVKAADTVCGDGSVDAPEQCDDGNLRSGDGCSNACTNEICGNAVIDANEQCDDGNTKTSDGCNQFCQIEFCGDSVTQVSLGEECDDGNGLSGDGCTSTCRNENSANTDFEETPVVELPTDIPVESQVPAQPAVPPVIVLQAQLGIEFFTTPDGQDYLQHLTREEVLELETILKKLGSGRRLTKEERAWAVTLYVKLQEAIGAERSRYTDLLKQFISTPISTEVVDEKDLQKSRLVDVEVPVAINELQEAVDVIRRGELQSQVLQNLAKLKRQGVDLSTEFPVDVTEKLEAGTRPIEVFATLKGLKEAAEQYASSDVPLSLDTIRLEAEALKDALPVFKQEYGLEPSEVEPFLDAIDTLAGEVSKQEVERVVGAVNRFLAVLERKKIVSAADFAALDGRATHAAATASRLIRDTGRQNDIVTEDDVAAVVDGLSEAAPLEMKPVFERGTEIAQRVELLKFLEDDARIAQLRETMRKDGVTEFDFRYADLRMAIGRVGTDNQPETPCDDSMPDALRCTNVYLEGLEDAARKRTVFTRFIGNLQDYFGIGQ